MLPRNRFFRSPEGVILTAVLLIFALYYLTQEQDGALSWRVHTLDRLPEGGVVLVPNRLGRSQLQQPRLVSLDPAGSLQHLEVEVASMSPVGPYTTAPPYNDSALWPCGIDPANVSALADGANFSMKCDVATSANNVAEELGNLILDLTQIQRKDYKSYLREQLCSSSKSALENLWLELSDFQKAHACEGCPDPRPPPRTALPPTARLPPIELPEKWWRGHRLPLLAVRPGGRLGNQMGEYATALALHHIYGVSVFVTDDMHANLTVAFPNISLPPLQHNATANWTELGKDGGCEVRRYRGLELAAAGLLGARPFLVSAYPFEMHLFSAYRRQLLHEFRFHPKIVAKAKARLRNFTAAAGGGERGSPVTVGVHVRLSDYPGFMKREFRVWGLAEAYHSYLGRAVAYFERRHRDVVFVVTSDDVSNTSAIFEGLGTRNVFVSNGTAPEDLCLLSLCRHAVLTFGTFGFWGGYLSGGTVLYPHLHYPSHTQYMLTRDKYVSARIPNFVPLPFYPT